MNQLDIHLDAPAPEFAPASTIAGNISWQLESPKKSLELRLFWYTFAIDTRHVKIVETIRIDDPPISGRRSFSFHLPAGPYSFAGKLIKLTWAMELVAEPGAQASTLELVVAPGGKSIRPDYVQVAAIQSVKL